MVTVEHLTKYYGDVLAVDDLSFEIGEGLVYGLLGPNGAGKSTTMNIMTGCLSATEGTVSIDGHDIFEEPEAAKKLIGYLPEQPPLYPNETPLEYLKFVGAAKGLKKKELAEQIASVVERTGLEPVKNRLISQLSKGFKQRVGIAQALLGNPEVIILDEPTVGLDPIQIIEIRDLIKSLGKEHTVILSSHILSEVQVVCEKVMIISHGRLVAFDTPEELERMVSTTNSINVTIEANAETTEAILASALNEDIEREIKAQDDETTSVHILFGENDSRDIARKVFFAAADAGCAILDLSTKKATLEDAFLELTELAPVEEESSAEEEAISEEELAAEALAAGEAETDETEEASGDASEETTEAEEPEEEKEDEEA